jgi:starch synthase
MFKSFQKQPKILFVASEAAPFVKIGGLGEVMYSLPKALRELGYDARIMIPKYASIDTEKFPLQLEVAGIKSLTDDSDPYDLLVSNILKYVDKNGHTTAYFLENMEYYEKRANVYGYGDDTIRWVLLSKGVLEFLKRADWRPDIIVASDWQTGFIPNLLRTDYKDDPVLCKIKVIFSIHNLQFQGLFDHRFVSEMDFDAGQAKIPAFFDPKLLKLNGMRRGIIYADLINTVSPTYAREILNEELGEKLNGLLSERRSILFGILNGIDTDSFNPLTDPNIATNYSINNLDRRIENKIALQKHFGLPVDENKFVIGIVSRMDGQKGFDLIIQIADSLIQNVDFQLVIVGTGSNEYRCFFQELQKKYFQKIAGYFFFDNKLPRMIFAGADSILIPSRFEPSGLVQMEAMRYGAIPIVRKTGGLADSVEDYVPGEDKGTGFVFNNYDQYALLIAIIRALEVYRNKKEWAKLMRRAMAKDFSWKGSAKEYIKLFSQVLNPAQKRVI